MKYINHMTSSSDDEKHEELIEKCGMAGYGSYWVVAEKIAAQIRPECVSTSLTLSWRNWARHLRTSTQQAQFWLRSMDQARLVILTELDGAVKVDMPNILKYADEYTRKVRRVSGQNPDKIRSNAGLPELPALPALPAKTLETTDPPSNGFSPDDMAKLWNEGIEFFKKDGEVLIPKIIKLTDKRRKKAADRIMDCQVDEARWREIINAVHQSLFLSGKKPSKGHGNWVVDFNFVVDSQTNFIKILEGGYR